MIPKRVSALNGLASCPGFAALNSVFDNPSGKAAATGTAVGRAAQLWHELGETPTALAAALTQTETELIASKADFDDVRVWATGYATDPRNLGVVLPGSCEKKVTFSIGEFSFEGHTDQIRRTKAKGLRLWDIKSGQGERLSACSCGELDKVAMGGREMVTKYAWQISAYSLAATETLGEPVLPGGIIRIRGYAWNKRCKWDPEDMSTAPVFFYTPWDLDVCREMMDSAHAELEALARGDVKCTPGTHCQWCPGEAPHMCGDKIYDTFGGDA